MNEHSEMKALLQKFILNECSQQEIEKVIAYYRNNTLTDDFPTVEDIRRLDWEIAEMDLPVADKMFSGILSKAKEPQTKAIRLKPYKKYMAIAAAAVVLLAVGLSYRKDISPNKNAPVLTGNEITLQLENGSIQVISEKGKTYITDAKGTVIGNHNGNRIAYDTDADVEKLVYNTIKIPNGKRFELQLSDGTHVHLNAGTTLKYPVKFIAGENRQVFLDGEAYFDVAKDKKHPFIVNADNLNIRVLGTHFNVSNYPEDDVTDVVLVEGAVGMYAANTAFDANKNTVLKPGYLGSFDRNNAHIDTKAVVTSFYTSWIKGGVSFRNMTFANIAKKLERRYDVTILNQNKKLAETKFNASFGDEPIEKILGYFNEVHGIKYIVAKDKILIK